jgi:hypothetical protein
LHIAEAHLLHYCLQSQTVTFGSPFGPVQNGGGEGVLLLVVVVATAVGECAASGGGAGGGSGEAVAISPRNSVSKLSQH